MWKMMLLLASNLLAADAMAVTWTYDNERNGQEDWSDLSPTFEKCNKGENQSPISIGATTVSPLPALAFHYQPGKVEFSLDRYTCITGSNTPQTFTEGATTSTLKEMMIRSPSEHEVTGAFYAAELQFIHARADKTLVIVSVFVQPGRANPALQTLIDHFPKDINDHPTAEMNWSALLPEKHSYYAYSGSLSYPPCTEGVERRVLKTPIEASTEQLQFLLGKLGRNSRSAQPIFTRTILESGE